MISNYSNWAINGFQINQKIPFSFHLYYICRYHNSHPEGSMASSYVQLPDLIMPNGAAVSNILNSPFSLDDAEAVALYAFGTIEAGTYTIEVSPDPKATAANTDWVTLQIGDPAGDAAPPATGKARVYYENAVVGALRIRKSVNATQINTWKAGKAIYL
jgi:hypothetical protein